jgi:hypothetical protein
MTLECPNAETAMGYCFSSFVEHVAPTELGSLVGDEAINIAPLTRLQLMERLERYGECHR